MKKLVSAVAAVAALMAASGAHAAWDNGQADQGSSNGELLLAVWDVNTGHQVSVAQDLGTTFQSFVDNDLTTSGASLSYDLNSSAFSVFATSNAADLRYAVIGISNNFFDAGGVTQRLLATTKVANPVVTSSDLGNVINAASVIPGKINHAGDTNFTVNNAVTGSAATGDYLGTSAVMGPNFTAHALQIDITGSIGDQLAMYEFNGGDVPSGGPDVKAVGTWSINLTTDKLTYSAAPAVPVPAAAWLMGSALLGLGSVGRRRRV